MINVILVYELKLTEKKHTFKQYKSTKKVYSINSRARGSKGYPHTLSLRSRLTVCCKLSFLGCGSQPYRIIITKIMALSTLMLRYGSASCNAGPDAGWYAGKSYLIARKHAGRVNLAQESGRYAGCWARYAGSSFNRTIVRLLRNMFIRDSEVPAFRVFWKCLRTKLLCYKILCTVLLVDFHYSAEFKPFSYRFKWSNL